MGSGFGKIRAPFFMFFMVFPTETLDKNTMYHKRHESQTQKHFSTLSVGRNQKWHKNMLDPCMPSIED